MDAETTPLPAPTVEPDPKPAISAAPEQTLESNQPGPAEAVPFRDQLPEPLRNHDCLENVETLDDLARLAIARSESSRNLERVLGKKLDRLDRDDVLAILGRPDGPQAYDFSELSLPDGIAWDNALETRFRGWAFEAGLTKQQAQSLGARFAEHAITAANAKADHLAAAQRDALREAHVALRRDWGETTTTRVAQAHIALARFGGEGLVERLSASGLDQDPDLLRFVDQAVQNAAGALGEDGGAHRNTDGGAPGNAEARRGIDARYRDQDFMRAYTGPDHPGHAAAVSEMQALFEASRP